MTSMDREPTVDDLAGTAWWNGMPKTARAWWAGRVGTGVAADAWAFYKATSHDRSTPQLEAAVAASPVEPKHARLLKALRAIPGFEEAKWVGTETGWTMAVRKVLSAAGEVLHADHRAWLEAEVAIDHGHARVTFDRLRDLGHQLSECAITKLAAMVDRGGAQEDVLQLTIEQHDEVIDRKLFDPRYDGWRGPPRTLDELIELAEDGERVADEAREIVGPSTYRLCSVIDMTAFLRTAQAVHRERQERGSRRQISVTEISDAPGAGPEGRQRVMTGAQLDPDWDRYACRERRLFDDWAASSAGRSGARICDHWSFKITDHIQSAAERWVQFIPQWTTTRKLAKLDRRPPSDYALYGKLEALDKRVGVPFAWFFFMLHGNRVQDWAGKAVLEAAEAGRIVLPEHDYQVLQCWAKRPYGF